MLRSSAPVRRILALAPIMTGLVAGAARADVLVSTYDGSSVLRYDETTGQPTATGQIASGSGGLSHAQGIAQGPDGSLYVSSGNTGQILHYGFDGSYIGVFATLPADSFGTASPGPLHFGPDGFLYVSDNGGSNVYRYNTVYGALQGVAVTGLSGGGGFAFAPNGDLYVSDFGGARVVKRDAITGATSDFISPGSSPLETPDGILFTRDNRVLVTDLFGNSVQAFDRQGNYQSAFVASVPPPGSIPSNYPGGIAYDRNGQINLAVLGADHNSSGTILRYNASGTLIDTGPFISGIPAASDLTFVSPQTYWNSNAGGIDNGIANFGDPQSWDAPQVPNGVGVSAVFGNGTTNKLFAGQSITVSVDGAYTVGSLRFVNSNGNVFHLASDGDPLHGITLDNGGLGASINAASGLYQTISTPLTLADSGGNTFYVAMGQLDIQGKIGQSGGSQSLSKSGGGTLFLRGANTFTGGVTIFSGVIVLDPSGPNAVLPAGTTVSVNSGAAGPYNGASLELIGNVSGMGSVADGVIVHNNNTNNNIAGVQVLGTNQQAGGIDGIGSTEVTAGNDLTVGYIIQSALVIDGTASSHGMVTIAPSSSPVFLGSPTSSMELDGGGSSFAAGSVSLPEPSTMFLTLASAVGLLAYGVLRQRCARRA